MILDARSAGSQRRWIVFLPVIALSLWGSSPGSAPPNSALGGSVPGDSAKSDSTPDVPVPIALAPNDSVPGVPAPDDSATRRITFRSVQQWEESLDHPNRALWQLPDSVVTALRLPLGARVADIGAGTGYFNYFLAEAVGDSGMVFVEEVEPELVAHLAERARREGTPQVIPILGTRDDPRLPFDLDLIFVCDTYRYIDARRKYFDRLRGNLEPEGRLVIIDFKPTAKDSTRIPAMRVVSELEEAGYRLVEELTVLPKQYFLVFRPRPGP